MSNTAPKSETDTSTDDNQAGATATNMDSTDADASVDAYTFGCPHCEATYIDERLVRVHITRSDDEEHRNRNGLMPEEEVELRDGDGEVIDTISRQPEEVNLETLDIENFPSELSDKRRHALVVASQNPHEDTRQEIARLVKERLAKGEYDTEPPHAQTVARAIDAFYHPAASTTDDEYIEPLGELAVTQQAIVIARLACPETSKAGLADIVGCANTYPGRILRQKSDTVEALQHRLEDGESLITILAGELEEPDISALHEEGLIDDIPIDISELAADMDEINTDETPPNDGIDRATDPPSPNEGEGGEPEDEETGMLKWGSPVADHGVMKATPDNQIRTAATPEEPATGTQARLPDAESGEPAETSGEEAGPTTSHQEPAETDAARGDDSPEVADTPNKETHDSNMDAAGATQPHDSRPSPESGMIAQIETLEANVAFLRETIDPITNTDGPTALVESLARQVEQRCEAIRHADTEF